ncbi:MAG: hypothetical protein IPJ68_00720 [Candidatus Moraniibacteriota bacterium]|nr:MAG: hypothetical protein IPJ68_00720 [Candidatus Moranbacteria bacterium]
MSRDFSIIFTKLDEVTKEDSLRDTAVSEEVTREEAEEITELRRIALEIKEGEVSTYTTAC